MLKIGAADPVRRVGGLPLALRLALDAQRAGATSLLIESSSTALDLALSDPRMKLRRVDRVPEGHVSLELPAHCVVHRQLLAQLRLEDRSAGECVTFEQLPLDDPMPFWFPPVLVVDEATAKQAERGLFRALRKAEDGWTSRWLNRYVSLAISRHLAKSNLSPNHLSLAILAVGLFGAFLASRGGYVSMLLGAFLFQMQSILDGCDGELSRVTYRGSYLGEWLDTIGDDLTNYAFFVGAAVGLYTGTGSGLYLFAGSAILFSGVISSGLEYRYLLSIHSGDLLKYPLSQATTSQSGRFGFIAPLFKRDTFVFLTLLAAAANVLGIALLAFAIAALGVFASVLATELRLVRERKAARPQ